MSSGGGLQKLLPLLAGGALGASAFLLRHKGKSLAPIQAPSSALDGNVPQIVTPSYQPEPPVLQIPDSGGAVQNQVPVLTGIQNVLDKYGPVPKIYGKRRVFPKLAAEFVLQPRGNETAGLALFIVGQGAYQISDIKIGDTKITDFAVNNVAYRVLPGDDPVNEKTQLFSTDFKTSQYSDALVYDTWVTKSAPQVAVILAVDVTFPGGLWKKNSAGQKEADTIDFDVEYSLVGSGIWTKVPPPDALEDDPSISVTDNTDQVTKKHLEWTVEKGAYLVRIKRLTTQTHDGVTFNNQSQWTLLRATGDTPMVNPWKDNDGDIIPMCYIEVVFRSSEQFNGVINSLSCIAESKLPTWDGAAWTAPTVTRSPAWCIAEMLTGPACPNPMDKTELDPDVLEDWAEYCVERGFHFDQIYDSETTIGQLLDECSEAGRGSVHVRDGKHCVIFDRLQTVPIQHFLPHNIVKDSFQGHRSDPDLPHAVKVRWINPDIEWQQDERIVYADGYSATGDNGTQVATIFERINSPGCTTSDQAFRHGRYRLKCAYLRREDYKITVGWDNLACDRGDLVRFTHDVALFGFGSGKIIELVTNVDGDLTAVRLDTFMEMADGFTYGIQIQTDIGEGPDNVVDREINTITGGTDQMIFATPYPFGSTPWPAVGNRVAFGFKSQESLECLVERIDYQNDFIATLTLVENVQALYDVETEPAPAFVSKISVRPKFQVTVPPPVVLNVRSDESVLVKHSDGSLITRALLTMQAPPAAVSHFEVQYRRDGATTWISLPLVPVAAGEVSVLGLEDGVIYNFQIRNRTALSFVSTWVPFNHLVIGKTTPPPPVSSLVRNKNVLFWTIEDAPLDLAGVRIKFNRGANGNWAAGTLVADRVQSTQWDMTSLPGGPMTIMVCTVDTAGNESDMAILLKDFGDPPIANVLDIHSEQPDFTGTITNGTIDGGVLEADDDGGLFWTGPDESEFWGGNDSDLFWNDSFEELIYEFSYTPDAGVCGENGFNLSLDTTIFGENVKVEYRTAGESLFWDGDDGEAFWGPGSEEFWGPDEDWALWPGQIEATLQTYYFKVTCSASGLVQGRIVQLDVVVDVPDIIEYIDDFEYDPGSAETLPVTPNKFRVIKNIQLTLQYDSVNYPDADKIRYINKDVAGPKIVVLDSGDVPAAGLVDAIVTGYGGLQ